MEVWQSKLFEVEECMQDFNDDSFYNSALKLFQVLGYPVNKLEQMSEIGVNEFLMKLNKDESFINNSEKRFVEKIKSLSILFALTNDTDGLNNVEPFNNGVFAGESIIFVGIELHKNEMDLKSDWGIISEDRTIELIEMKKKHASERICLNYLKKREEDVLDNNFGYKYVEAFERIDSLKLKEHVEVYDEEIRDYIIPNISNFINRLINTQVFIVFKYGTKIAFSVKQRRVNKREKTRDAKGSSFQTKWINTLPISYEDLVFLSEMSIDNMRDTNFYLLYFDLISCVADGFLLEENDEEIGSHIKICDSLALYFRDIHNIDADFKDNIEFLVQTNNQDDVEKEKDFDDQGVDTNTILNLKDVFLKPRENDIAKVYEGVDESNSNTIVNDDEYETVKDAGTKNASEVENEIVENKIAQDILNNLSSLIEKIECLKVYYRNERKDEPENLSIDELQKHVNSLFEKTKVADLFKNEVSIVKNKFSTVLDEFSNVMDDFSYIIGSNNGDVVNMRTELNEGEVEEDLGSSDIPEQSIENLDSYLYTTPYKITILDTVNSVSNWTDVLVIVCEMMLKLCPEKAAKFDKNTALSGRSRVYFSYDASVLTKSAKSLSNALYVETNFSADSISKLCKDILVTCGYSSNDIRFYVNKRQHKQKKKSSPQSDSANTTSESEIKFSLKYSSICISEELLKTIFLTISEYDNNDLLFMESADLNNKLSDFIKNTSPYKNPQHVIINILKFLIDWDVINLYKGSKRGKYVIKDVKTLYEMIDEPKMIVELLKNE